MNADCRRRLQPATVMRAGRPKGARAWRSPTAVGSYMDAGEVTGWPSASTMRTYPRSSARTAASVCLRSPTTTHTSLSGSMVAAARFTWSTSSASIRALRSNT